MSTPQSPDPHEPYYEWDDEWTSVECICNGFFRICESHEVAETEFRNHVDLAGGDQ